MNMLGYTLIPKEKLSNLCDEINMLKSRLVLMEENAKKNESKLIQEISELRTKLTNIKNNKISTHKRYNEYKRR